MFDQPHCPGMRSAKGGAPHGTRNGNWRNGHWTNTAVAERQRLRGLLLELHALIASDDVVNVPSVATMPAANSASTTKELATGRPSSTTSGDPSGRAKT